jgi:hypothetical protein
MNRTDKSLAATFLSALSAAMLFTSAAQAMEIRIYCVCLRFVHRFPLSPGVINSLRGTLLPEQSC